MKINIKNHKYLAFFCLITFGAFQSVSANPDCMSQIHNYSNQTWTFWFERTGDAGPLDYDVKQKQYIDRRLMRIPCTKKTPCTLEGHTVVDISYLLWEDKKKKSDLVPVKAVFVDRNGGSKYWESSLTGFFQGVNICHKFNTPDFNPHDPIAVNSPANGDFSIWTNDFSTKR
ncbi:hypothetical protein [Solimicrobium silvestre]|uniref:Uncharacterized protein n=1 Tax=Solimicrobium silvestre TaxID=2099400 RepID=A0A2S9GZT4_9BURK|nr:hypothetical protein [Solimicrobium silvestre]PRC93227.1 hypothetical protein S2091_1965 [Solimicrobium silvestre]